MAMQKMSVRQRLPLPVKSGAESIPEELRALPQWVARGREPGDKVPVDPRTGRNASISDPSTWGTYEEATSAVQKHKLQGVGFVFTSTDPFVGIDIDKCRDPQTGKVEEWAQEIVQGLASYTEVSPSGTGLHILARGGWPEGANKKGQIEVYDHARYFTVTGEVVDMRRTIEERTPELEKLRLKHFGPIKVRQKIQVKPVVNITSGLTDEDIIEKAQNAANGAKFKALWEGNWQSDYTSPSEAVLALLNILAFHASYDRERVDGLFRLSGLYSDKWDSKRRDTTYGELQLDLALASQLAPTKIGHAFDNAVISFNQLEAMDLPEQGFLLEPWLLASSLNLISAEAGTGKTFFALEVAAACAEGREAMAGHWRSPTRTNVLIVDGEMLPVEIRARGRSLGMVGHCQVLSKTLFEKTNPQMSLNLADEAIQNWLLAYVQEQRVGLLILDNIYSLIYRLDSNSDKDWQPVNAWLLKLKSLGVSVLLVHHSNKRGEQLGTSSRVFNLDTHLVLKKLKAKRPHAAFTIEIQKSRHQLQGIDGPTYEFKDGQWVVTAGEVDDSNTDQSRREVAQNLVDGVSQKQIAADLGCTASYVSQLKKGLVRDGLLIEDRFSKQRTITLTDSGEEWMHRVEE